ncbi:MAG: NCS2 family permease [Eubacteriales bacterium]|nr:NCS2 family permease [Eubacteriales bacterium]
MLEFLEDLLAALGVILNGLPQGLLALSYGFASVPTALGFAVGAASCAALGSTVPISFQAETIVLAGSMGKDRSERTSMVFFAGLLMLVLGLTGGLGFIVELAGDRIITGMMAGVGLMLARIALQGAKEMPLVTYSSILIACVTYVLSKGNLVYTIIISVVLSSAINYYKNGKIEGEVYDESRRLKLVKPKLTWRTARGAAALACLTIGANIAFGQITASMAGGTANVDHLTAYSGAADALSALFGGGPVEAIISATAAAPHAVLAGIMMMSLMAIILFMKLLPKIGKYVPSASIYGFLFILGAVVTVPVNAGLAFNGASSDEALLAGVSMAVTAGLDPFLGLLAGLVVKAIIHLI